MAHCMKGAGLRCRVLKLPVTKLSASAFDMKAGLMPPAGVPIRALLPRKMLWMCL